MFKQMYFAALAAALLISGCSSDGNERREKYLDADYYTRLELPPDLTATDDSSQLNVPRPSDEATAKFKQETASLGSASKPAAVGIAFNVKGARMQTGDGLFWLEVDENADKLWPQLSAFWGHEGIKIVRNQPMLGVVETDWVSKLQVDEETGFIARLFNSLNPDKLDKFTMRVEPEPDAGKTKIFMSHTGREKSVEGDVVNWRSRCSEEELEREMLSRLALFVGLDEVQSKQVFENYRPFASRVEVPEDGVNKLYVTGEMDFVWQRSLRALDRMQVEVLAKDSAVRQMQVAIKKISRQDLGQERDEIAENSWLNKWLSGADDNYLENESRQFTLKFSADNGVVTLEILRPDGEPAESVLAEQFRKTLALEFFQ